MKKYNIIWILLFLLINISYAQNWGAMYMDIDTGIAGGSGNYRSNASAKNAANESCVEKHQKRGIKSNCELIISASNACMVIYWSPINKKIGSAYGTFQDETKYVAYQQCAQRGGKDCKLSLITCSDRVIY